MNRNVIRTLCALLIAVLLLGISSAALAEKEIPSNVIRLPIIGNDEQEEDLTEAEEEPEDIDAQDHSDREVRLHCKYADGSDVEVGTEIILTAELIGYEDAPSVEITWQYSPDGETFYDLDEHGTTYTFRMSEEVAGYSWRAHVTAGDEE